MLTMDIPHQLSISIFPTDNPTGRPGLDSTSVRAPSQILECIELTELASTGVLAESWGTGDQQLGVAL